MLALSTQYDSSQLCIGAFASLPGYTSAMIHFSISLRCVNSKVLPSTHDPISYPDSGLSVDHDASTNTPVPQSFFLLPPRSLQKTCSMTPEAFRAHCQNRWKLLDVPHTVTTVPREHCGATRQMAKPLSSDLPWSQLHFLMYFLGATNISNWNPLDSSHVISG